MRPHPRVPRLEAEPRHGPQTVPDEPGQKETGGSGAKIRRSRRRERSTRAHHATPPCAPACLPAASLLAALRIRLCARAAGRRTPAPFPISLPPILLVSTTAEADQGEDCFGRS